MANEEQLAIDSLLPLRPAGTYHSLRSGILREGRGSPCWWIMCLVEWTLYIGEHADDKQWYS